MYRCLYILAFLLMSNSLFAQSDSIVKLAERLESSNKHEAAIKEINEVLKNKGLTTEDRLAIQTTLVHKYQELQQWDTCLGYCQEQIALAHQQNNSLVEASFYKLIGNTYYHIPDKDKAVSYWEKCIAISESNGFNILLEHCYHNIGSLYLEKGQQYDQAEKYLLKSIELSLANKTTETALGRLHYRLLATLYERTNRLNKAEDLYKEVIRKSRALKDSSNLAEALMFYSEVLNKQKKIKDAVQVSAQALQISRAFSRLDMVQTALDLHSRNLYEAGNYKEAYLMRTEMSGIIFSRYNNDLTSKISEAEAKFKTEEAEHEKQLTLVETRKEKQIYILGLIGLFAVVGLLLYNFNQRKNAKQKVQMQQQLQEEKERLSRDLHDNLGSQMALLSNNVESLDTNHKKQNSIDDNIENVKGTSKQLLQTLRETIWILNKEQISTEDFFDKLIDYAHRYIQGSNNMRLQVSENFAENKELNSNEALQLFRICQETITNACKYSTGDILAISGKVSDNKFEIEIADNGKGFDRDKIGGTEHYGLKNMKQRAEAIKALLKIDIRNNEGVVVSVIL